MTSSKAVSLLALLTVLYCGSKLKADTFGVGINAFDIEFVAIGNANNVADSTGVPNPAGSVGYSYRIGKYEVSEDAVNKANAEGGLGITHSNRGANKPADAISWLEAARFVNWLNTSSALSPAYKFDGSGAFQLWAPGDAGYNPNNAFRNSLAKYWLPSIDEWYKAAYFDRVTIAYFDYPTASNSAPSAVSSGTAAGTSVFNLGLGDSPADVNLAGGLSPYGTMGQGGNVWEWLETQNPNDVTGNRPLRGGGWFDGNSSSQQSTFNISANPGHVSIGNGFRVASVPEPATAISCILGSLVFLRRRNNRKLHNGIAT